MTGFKKGFAVTTLALILSGGAAVAQDHPDNHHYVRHQEWKKGYHLQHGDWDRGDRIAEWRQYHLTAPPAGDEWRLIDGQYVLASSDGVVLRVVVAH
jgi:Ni/Co efflux regulator RcnB